MTEEMPVVIECPSCGERYLIWPAMSELPQGTTYYSDGYFTSDNKWRTPEIIGCVTCELGFTPQNGKIIATPNREEFHRHSPQPPEPWYLSYVPGKHGYDEESSQKRVWYAPYHSRENH